MTYTIREATPADEDSILELLPRLAAFDRPPRRSAEEFWHGDDALLKAWSAGQEPQCLVLVAVDESHIILGAAMVRLREELLSHAPSAHLEVLVVREDAEGQGVGKALVQAAEQRVRTRGALSMTLHVFARNTRARAVYEQLGYDGEMLRYIKHLV